jgi:hypothetical protein
MVDYYIAVGSNVHWNGWDGPAEIETECVSPAIAQIRADWLNRAAEIAGMISDDSKDLYGFRTRLDWKSMSLCDLRKVHNDIRDAYARRMEWEDEAARVREAARVEREKARVIAENRKAAQRRAFDKGFNSLRALL